MASGLCFWRVGKRLHKPQSLQSRKSVRTECEVKEVLELRHVTKMFFGNKALDDVTFTAYPGEIHALMGQNGAGKSTLMKILSGAYTLDSGTISIDGAEVKIHSPKDAEAYGIAIVYQELSVLPHLSAAANIVIGREPMGRFGLLNKRKAQQFAAQALERLGVKINPNIRLGNLSVSQQQICEIAKAISKNPKIVILDEPTAALTNTEREALFAVMRKMRDDGMTVIFITHHLEEVFEVAQRCTVLRDGKVAYTGQVDQLSDRALVELMVGHEVGDFFPQRITRPSQNAALELKEVAGGIVQPTSFKLHYGEVVGLSGLIGAGRTELARMVFGADKMASGALLRDGREVKIHRPADAIRHGIALITEDRRIDGLALNMSIRFNISFPNIVAGDERLLSRQFVRRSAEHDMALKAADRVKIKHSSVGQRVISLSGGNQQKTAIAKWVATGAKVYIFDEPTKGIDVASKIEVYKVINELAENGAAVLVISSYNPELIGICDRILVMARGRITQEFGSNPAETDLILAQSM